MDLPKGEEMSYQRFAYVYDQLMKDAPYDSWLQFVERVVTKYEHPIRHVLDLACGTGSIAIPLAAKGYKVTGIDLSEDMLAMSYAKSQEAGVTVDWIQQDMLQLELSQQVDTIVCFCDSLNYVTEDEQIIQLFHRIYEQLTPNGYFLCDLHSIHKLKHVFGDHTFGTHEENVSLLWQSFYDEEQETVDHELSFFIQEEQEDLYRRFDEVHTQKGYRLEDIMEWLYAVGFEIKEVTADFSEQAPEEESERLFIVAFKK